MTCTIFTARRAAMLVLVMTLLSACATRLPDPRTMHFEPIALTSPPVMEVGLAHLLSGGLALDDGTIVITRLDNGLTLYLQPDRQLPLVRLNATIRGGSLYLPVAQQPIPSIAAQLMRSGGMVGKDGTPIAPQTVNETLSSAAILLSSGCGTTKCNASVNTLTRHLPTALDYFSNMLQRPLMDTDQLEVEQGQRIEHILRQRERPGSIAYQQFSKQLYGDDHPLGHPLTVAQVEAVSREDLLTFHRRTYRPDRMQIGVSGDFEVIDMVRQLQSRLGDWQPPTGDDDLPLPVAPPWPALGTAYAAYSHMGDGQSVVALGHLALARTDPDYYAMALANLILGGEQLTSRLFRIVRTEHGLAYAVSSSLVGGNIAPGMFTMSVRTRDSQVGAALELMVAEMRRMQTEPVSEQTLATAKEGFLNGFVFRNERPAQALYRRMHLDYVGLPADELTRTREGILAVTSAQLQAATQKHLHPDRLVVSAVGDREQLLKALAPLAGPNGVQQFVPDQAQPTARHTATSPP